MKKRTLRRGLALALSVIMALSLLVIPAAAEGTTTHTVWIVGDSTACDYAATEYTDLYYTRCGYGTKLADYVAEGYTVRNLALSGRSSKSFLGEAYYETLKTGIQAGDILIIGWGHNDEKATDSTRYTSPTGDWQTEGSFAKSLYDNYVKLAQDKGATPILCTPIVRRATDGVNFSDANLHIANGGSYTKAIIDLGTAKSVPVVDLTDITKTQYLALGATENAKLHAWATDEASSVDNTHLNKYGAKWVAYWLAKAVTESTDALFTADVKAAFSLTTGEPTAADLAAAVTPNWTKPEYTAPADDAASTDYTSPFVFDNQQTSEKDQFKPTGFGDVSLTGPTLEVTEDNQIHINGNASGKIAGDHDGIFMYYYRIPKDKVFTLTATAKVNSLGTGDKQTAFGLMARDDMYIDKKATDIKSNYVVAGCLTQNASTTNCYYRKDGALGNTSTLTTPAVKTGDTVELSIVSNTDGYTCAIDGQTAQSGGFDIPLFTVDTAYLYVGMFANRNADVYFRNIYLEIDGQVICDTRSSDVPFAFQVLNDGWKFEDASGSPSETAVDGGKLTAITAVKDGNEPAAVAVAAVYNLNGRMTGVKVLPIQNGEIPVGLKMNGGETAKVFLLGAGLAPMQEAATITSGEPARPDVDTGKIQVWDFAAQEESDADLYENRITASSWTGKNVLSSGTLTLTEKQSVSFGDLTYTAGNSDKLYTKAEGLKSYGATTSYEKDFGDGYTSSGGIYANGKGDSGKRFVQLANVKAGDKIVAYIGSAQNGPVTFSAGTGGAADYTLNVDMGTYQKGEFIAKQDGDFKIWMSAGDGKPFYMRIMRLKPAQVSGTITLSASAAALTGYGLTFINAATGSQTAATVNSDGTFSAQLAPGYTYIATLTGVTGYGFTNLTRQVAVTDAESVTGKANVALAVEAKTTYTYSGAVTGFAEGYDVSKLAITLTPDEFNAGQGSPSVKPTVTGTSFSAAGLEPGVTYTVTLDGVNDYAITGGGTVTNDAGAATVEQDITVATKPTYTASGSFVTLDADNAYAPLYEGSVYSPLADNTVTTLTFTNVDDDYPYTTTATANGYSIDLRDGAYAVTATANGYATTGHVVVAGGAVTKDLMFVSTAEPEAVAYAADVYVGDSTQTLNFNTITGALAYIKRMTRPNDERVTVHIAPGTYREQLQIDSKNVTLVNAQPGKEVKITWYYGIGYKYYSASGGGSTTSVYDPERAFDKYEKNIAGRWGAVVWVTADGFKAQDITFESSFNNDMTDEELADGVELAGSMATDSKITAVRDYALEVSSKAATERAAALYVDGGAASATEFKNCQFRSSQDTIITGGKMYFTNCLIEGMTDYLCGPGNVVFDGCELRFKGYHKDYTDAATGGHLTAPQNSGSDKGYLFRSCAVTANPDANMTVGTGDFGRPWSATAGAMFLNTRLERADLISAAGWSDMSGKQPGDANFREYHTTLMDGTAVDTAGRVTGTVLTDAPTVTLADYFGEWVPSYYTAENGDAVAFTTDPAVSTNGDPATPCYGNTLTVSYSLGADDANDVSEIKWYRIATDDANAAPELILTTAANVSRSYKTVAADANHYIQATVTPKTVGGKSGEAKSARLENAITNSYNDPTLPAGTPDLGDGVNIFLAGDSTVKDYSANGMYEGGTQEELGSWGEYFQAYFNKELVTVVNYANGGRSTRNFINEGSLDKIAANIKAGDYLFIQFGHNDCSDGEQYIEDRYVPVGTQDENGKYPTTAGTKSATPTTTLQSKYGAEWYSHDCGGTFKWFLKQYIDVAREKGATPVLITPVARQYYETDGTIKPHHDDSTSSNNAYCTAVKQLAEEENVLLIDGYTLTKDLFESAWTADNNNNSTYGVQLMGKKDGDLTDSTHCNKLGGMMEAALMAGAVQGLDLNISPAVKAPAQVQGKTSAGATVFSVNASGALTAYDILTDYTTSAAYWQTTGQNLFDAIAAKAAELSAPAASATE